MIDNIFPTHVNCLEKYKYVETKSNNIYKMLLTGYTWFDKTFLLGTEGG